VKGKKADMIPRPFLDIGVAMKEESSQQHPKGKLQESKNQKICTTELEASEKVIPRVFSNSSFKDVDEASETMSMIKKARVSVRARSVSSMVSI